MVSLGSKVLGTVHHSWKGLALRVALAGRPGGAVGRTVPGQEAEREERLSRFFFFVQSRSPADRMVPLTLKMGFSLLR